MGSLAPDSRKAPSALGFLTVIESPEDGLFGGYLILNTSGRPLEFHCTTPIKPNRAQQILYGATLGPYLFGEQIGQMLIRKATTEPLMVCTDRRPALAVREHVAVPVTLVLPTDDTPHHTDPSPEERAEEEPGGRFLRVDQADLGYSCGPPVAEFQLGRNRLAVPIHTPNDRQQVTDCLGELAESFDLAEPFGRIRAAIEEARRGGH